ncbi:hypothetical protein FHX37_3008 [Haloactinospora alba]|uniref:Uncharacterized protein n=1 Tax=Haloactinospora alba TaxID=405555 RepID=A0A543NMI3_9ACTN|nr:hypothetical protein [Haloactinospora alba]TQN33014.1 hypothetical protein FHX37_3008 [Haloactinospora alba]
MGLVLRLYDTSLQRLLRGRGLPGGRRSGGWLLWSGRGRPLGWLSLRELALRGLARWWWSLRGLALWRLSVGVLRSGRGRPLGRLSLGWLALRGLARWWWSLRGLALWRLSLGGLWPGRGRALRRLSLGRLSLRGMRGRRSLRWLARRGAVRWLSWSSGRRTRLGVVGRGIGLGRVPLLVLRVLVRRVPVRGDVLRLLGPSLGGGRTVVGIVRMRCDGRAPKTVCGLLNWVECANGTVGGDRGFLREYGVRWPIARAPGQSVAVLTDGSRV